MPAKKAWSRKLFAVRQHGTLQGTFDSPAHAAHAVSLLLTGTPGRDREHMILTLAQLRIGEVQEFDDGVTVERLKDADLNAYDQKPFLGGDGSWEGSRNGRKLYPDKEDD